MQIDQLTRAFAPPRFALEEVRDVLAEHYGLTAGLVPLAGERDQNVKVTTADDRLFVLKISGKEQDRERVDFEAKALAHLSEVAADLGLPAIRESRAGNLYVQHRFSNGDRHLIRLVTFLKGVPLLSAAPRDRGVLFEMGRLQGRVCRALASFFHPAARSTMPWDGSSDRIFDPSMLRLLDPATREHLAPHLDRLRTQALPALRRQRAQVIHNDVHTGNVLLDEAGRVSGLIDFGDSLHAPLLQDLAVSASSVAEFHPEEPEGAVDALVRGFSASFPLLEEERALLLDAAILRSLLCVQLGQLKAESEGVRPEQDQVLAASKEGLLALLSWQEGQGKAVGHSRPHAASRADREGKRDLKTRRSRVLSPTYELFYDEPLEIVRGAGTLLYDAEGREYLDCYNNVPSVGHGHPHVVEALSRQAERLNTHTRYLHDAILTYGERLTATLPPELEMCVLVCTGSEANDLAFSIARAVTGRQGVAVWEGCYHGNSARTGEISLYATPRSAYPPYVAALPLPDPYRASDGTGRAREAIEAIARSSHGLAMMMVDLTFDSAGIFTAPDGYLPDLVDLVRGLGGLVVVDEVQSGLCRLGDNMWAFQDSGVVPDIVTMGKPMGNGHPLGVVVAKRWIMEAFARDNHYFNTFGGNPVSATAGAAVLDVVENEALLQRVGQVGRHLEAGLVALQDRHEVVGDVRGKGLFLGVDLVSDRGTRAPAPEATNRVVNSMRRHGVLVSTCGVYGNVIKIRPPLVFSEANADRLLEVLDLSLGDLGQGAGKA